MPSIDFKTVPALLAVAYTTQLRAMLTVSELDEVNERNALQQYPGVCHSHDFCDPNEAMIMALEMLAIPLDLQKDECVVAINRATQIAKKAQFQNPPTSYIVELYGHMENCERLDITPQHLTRILTGKE